MQPPAAKLAAQQPLFNRFRREHNEERLREAFGMQTPEAVYTVSPQAHPERVAEPEYLSGMAVGRVYLHGQVFWWNGTCF